ncbi:MAG: MoaD/ThiS family protein [Lentisphaerae bacterium]|nr:MoaD/ThiS family protein [Lentisphaerota bacterium]
MKINVTYYAMFREQAGCGGEVVDGGNGDAVDLFESLKATHGLSMARAEVRLAVNDAFVDWSTPLHEGDSVVFIPPVAGG